MSTSALVSASVLVYKVPSIIIIVLILITNFFFIICIFIRMQSDHSLYSQYIRLQLIQSSINQLIPLSTCRYCGKTQTMSGYNLTSIVIKRVSYAIVRHLYLLAVFIRPWPSNSFHSPWMHYMHWRDGAKTTITVFCLCCVVCDFHSQLASINIHTYLYIGWFKFGSHSNSIWWPWHWYVHGHFA